MLTKDRKHLLIFDNRIEVNKDLPKWKRVLDDLKKRKEKIQEGTRTEPGLSANTALSTTLAFNMNNLVTPDYESSFEATPRVETIGGMSINLDDTAKMDIKELTKFITEFGVDKIYGWSFSEFGNLADGEKTGDSSTKKPGFLARLFKKREHDNDVSYELDVVSFFENVKLLSKESENTYKDLVGKYLSAVHAANLTGQVALKEKLARGLFVNKYEAVLAANGYYYAVTEDQVVKFANKTEKGVDLVYIKNFARPLPDEIIKKLEEANSLEVFDNYVVMAYDPNGVRKLETEKERNKRKDPILFGLILGSDKLYYITDWIDEKCDLTLQQFVDTINLDKEKLKIV